MEPQIKYALTEDGVSIAYWTIGEGRPFILPPGTVTSPSLRAWRTTAGHAFFERLAAHRMLVRYDLRGFGLSSSGPVDFSLEAQIRDLAAVVDKVGAGRVDLCAYLGTGPAVLAYAARNPERVSRLVLWATSPRGRSWASEDTWRVLNDLAKVDFELWKEAMVIVAMRYLGLDRSEDEYARSIIEGITPEWLQTPSQGDVTDLLGSIEAPTLIIHRRGVKEPSMSEVQAIAARIPAARLALLEGDIAAPYMGDTDSVLAAIDEFLGEGSVLPALDTRRAAGGLATILFTDIVGHTAMMQRLGDAKGRDVLREHERITREALSAHGGTEVKTDGDSFMASFASVSGAVECAVALQRAFARYSESNHEPIVVRIGLNAGEPIEEDGDFFGSAVILAARIKDQAGGGEILVPEAVRHMLSGKGFAFADRGEFALKGFEHAVRLYEVRWRE